MGGFSFVPGTGSMGTPWGDTDPRDAAYRNQDSSSAAQGFAPMGFNLTQWFTDQGVTDKSQMTYYRYAALRNLPMTEDTYAYYSNSMTENPYTAVAQGNDVFKMDPQNTAKDIAVAPNGAAYTPEQAAKLNQARENQSSRQRLNAVGTPAADPKAIGADAVLFRPTLLGGG